MALRRKDAKLTLLSEVNLFRHCSKSELRRIASLTDEIDAPQGKTLTREGEPGWECFVIAEGEATARRGGRKVGTIGPGSCIGEMSLLDQGPRTATVIADTDMRLLVLSSRSFSSLIDDVPKVGRRILSVMAERMRELERSPTH
jgi:CRP/FNR family transcriptional regulator, cyclic AMP receptor protein